MALLADLDAELMAGCRVVRPTSNVDKADRPRVTPNIAFVWLAMLGGNRKQTSRYSSRLVIGSTEISKTKVTCHSTSWPYGLGN